jgi:hypothetical protein
MMGMNGINNLAISGLKRSRRDQCMCAKIIRFYSLFSSGKGAFRACSIRCLLLFEVTKETHVGVGHPPDDIQPFQRLSTMDVFSIPLYGLQGKI